MNVNNGCIFPLDTNLVDIAVIFYNFVFRIKIYFDKIAKNFFPIFPLFCFSFVQQVSTKFDINLSLFMGLIMVWQYKHIKWL
jgi:hypothetical protein